MQQKGPKILSFFVSQAVIQNLSLLFWVELLVADFVPSIQPRQLSAPILSFLSNSQTLPLLPIYCAFTASAVSIQWRSSNDVSTKHRRYSDETFQ